MQGSWPNSQLNVLGVRRVSQAMLVAGVWPAVLPATTTAGQHQWKEQSKTRTNPF
ncbi:hypothetical protein PF007_g32333 [Phytophthora fragariae]|uniref:Uncharacterized protein n=1 Tax=Phytophthora fragariae TaxID=53985 RepID=A0A6A3DEM7_9STRA|nr:hypothetical protein PF009_g32710 [Phytophthora fragariae]KAE9055401.1 hypothetical protein PF007_g32333 [Phytophthora fragariae]KAE9260593.1 hypothetical protein PF001_g32673 [Phytophthora fragariae]